MKRKIIIEIFAALLIILFVYTGINKIIDHERFYGSLHKSSLLRPISAALSWVVPLIELAVAALIIVPKYRIYGLIGSTCMMFSFTAYVIGILRFSKEIPCTCGGVLQQMSWHDHIYFNLGYMAIAALALLFEVIERRNIQKEKFNEHTGSLNSILTHK